MIRMKRFIVEHKHCGARKPIDGNDFHHACKRWNCDPKIWKLIGEDKQEIKKYEIMMVIDGDEFVYGADSNRDKANEIAMQIREQRNIETYVREKE